jgi:hypothetical protein
MGKIEEIEIYGIVNFCFCGVMVSRMQGLTNPQNEAGWRSGTSHNLPNHYPVCEGVFLFLHYPAYFCGFGVTGD